MTLGVFRDVRFCIDLVNMALVFLAMAAYTFIFPYYLQEARGIGAGAAGLIMACYPLVNSIVGSVSGAVSDKVGCEKPTLVGQTIYTCGLAACSFLALGTPIPLLNLLQLDSAASSAAAAASWLQGPSFASPCNACCAPSGGSRRLRIRTHSSRRARRTRHRGTVR